MVDVDATIVIVHSEKEPASPTFKRTFAFHPLGVWCGHTSEFLTAKLRAGRAGSHTATDHIEVLADAIAQVPSAHGEKFLIRSDGAGAFHAFVGFADQFHMMERHYQGATYAVIDGAGHNVHLDAPGPVAALLSQWGEDVGRAVANG